MPEFDPTRPPPGRLARLGVTVDPLDEHAAAIARLCDRAGIEIVWFGSPAPAQSGDGLDGDAPPAPADPHELAASIVRARVGWIVDWTAALPDVAVEAWVPEAGGPDRFVPAIDDARGVRRSAALTDLAGLPALLQVVDDVVLPAWRFPDLETAADEVRAEAAELGRDPASLGVAAVVPRRRGGAGARAPPPPPPDPVFRTIGHPRELGIFGTLEECQDRVIALAHAGITDLRCVLPGALDVHDVIAQLTAITIGTTDVLIPGSLRSPAPLPPDGWGGRPDVPPRPRVSGGSRRR
jgi:hypothetical protein